MYRIGDEEIEAVTAVLRSGELFRYWPRGIEGDHRGEAAKLEAELAAAMAVPHAIAVSSGTAALHCALAALEIGPGDEVIIPGFTFVATATAVLAVGAVPIVAEVDETLTIDVDDVARKITDRTRAVIPVHMAGLPADLGRILELAGRSGLRVIEDACQAIGGTYRGRPLGAHGDVGCLSFNQFKTLTCGEGGAVLARDRRIHERALIFHDPGYSFISEGYELQEPIFAGLNLRTSELLAAMLRVQLRRLPGFLAALRRAHLALREALVDDPIARPVRLHDREGAVGSHLMMLLPDEDRAAHFAGLLRRAGLYAGRPADQRLHVYDHWEVLMRRRGGHVPARDPLHGLPEGAYHPAMCPRTLDLSTRAVGVLLSPLWDDDALRSARDALVAAAAEVR
ncbi:MAG: aminotransferase class I/II-fold pyridoxal phosphate-dependent enzyme [Nannocystaceae bacterium]